LYTTTHSLTPKSNVYEVGKCLEAVVHHTVVRFLAYTRGLHEAELEWAKLKYYLIFHKVTGETIKTLQEPVKIHVHTGWNSHSILFSERMLGEI
jgi:hypothetical protein